MYVIKRDNTEELFQVQKIERVVKKAFESCGAKMDSGVIDCVVSNFNIESDEYVKAKDIQDVIEKCLMDVNKDAARAYIANHEQQDGRIKILQKDNDFIKDYINASNASTGSKYDANANVESKNIVTLGQEIHKGKNIQQNRYMMFEKIKSMYSKKLANQYINDLESHVLYKHDESGTPGYPYCVAITMYPFLIDGLTKIGGQSIAPTDLKSYCGEFINLVYSVSSQFMGACLYKDQVINFVEDGVSKRYKIKDFIEKYLTGNITKFENYQGEWECAKLPGNIKVLEDGKLVDVLKVYRRKYNSDIYKISTKDGYEAYTSEDHVFKQLIQGRRLEVKAKQLEVNDTVFMNKDYSSVIDFNSLEFKRGWVIGMLCGDGCLTKENVVELSVNYEQEYLGEIFNEYSHEVYGYKLNKNEGHKCFTFTKMSKEFKDEVVKDILGNNTYEKHISLQNKSLDYIAGWLDGLFCSDGSYSESHGITISLTNKKLAENIREAVTYFGLPDKNLVVVKPSANRKESYRQYIPSRILKYLKHVHEKCLRSGCKNIQDVSREVYYYGYNSFQGRHNGNKRMLVYNSHQEEKYNTDVIQSIEKFKNDDEYVYEIETSSHWYNCGGFITHNCATPEFLMYMDYFIRKDYGDDYLTILDKQVELNKKGRTLEQVIENCFQQVVHSMNVPTGSRGYQTVFWNIGYFDKNYFDGVFGEFRFPDGTKPIWETLSWLQKKFMKWFNQERSKYILTFPVETMAMLTDGHDVVDKEYADFTCEMWAEGHSFFCYLSDSPDSLSSCCRLRNSLKDSAGDEEHNHNTHQFSMGTASVATGSKSVMTMNLNRLVQNATRKYYEDVEGHHIENAKQVDINCVKNKEMLYEYIVKEINDMTERVHKYQKAFNSIIKDFYNANMLDIYRAGFIDLRKQYLTVGVNGLTDAAEFLSIEANLNKDYEEFVNLILETINKSNKKDRTRDCMFNTEFVPGENLSNKNYKWDKLDGYYVSPKHIMYSSYFFNPEDTELSLLDKMKLHGNNFVKYLDGGQAAHININEHLSFEQYRQLLRVAAENGCSYYTYNVQSTYCPQCGHIDKHNLSECPKCGNKDVDKITRIIGYLKRVSSFSEPRQIEAKMRYYNE